MIVFLYDCVVCEECVLVVLLVLIVMLEMICGGGVVFVVVRVIGEVYVECCLYCGVCGEFVWLEEVGIFLLVGLIG